jgi:hypothetical protein
MKRTIQKITTVAIFAAAIVGTPALSRAGDTNAPAATAPAATPDHQSGPTKFYGTVSAVDTNAKTFTVGDQTFLIIGESQMTKDGKAATLAAAVVGEPARGSYTKGKDGKLDITKVRFGKPVAKTGGAAAGKAGGKKKKDAGAVDTNAPATPPQNQ